MPGYLELNYIHSGLYDCGFNRILIFNFNSKLDLKKKTILSVLFTQTYVKVYLKFGLENGFKQKKQW